MLKRILSIAGKPGLFRLVNQGKNMLIVENVANGKRMPAYRCTPWTATSPFSMCLSR